MTIDEAHRRCVHGDRTLWVIGELKGTWCQDHVLEYVVDHQDDECSVVAETDDMIVVNRRRKA